MQNTEPPQSLISCPSSTSCFRLFDLPQELQNRVYEHYFQHDIIVARTRRRSFSKHYIAQESDFKLPYNVTLQVRYADIPSIALDRTCRKVLKDTTNVRKMVRPSTLKIMCELAPMASALEALCLEARYAWLRECISELKFVRFHFRNGGIRIPWKLIVEQFSKLKVCRVSVCTRTWGVLGAFTILSHLVVALQDDSVYAAKMHLETLSPYNLGELAMLLRQRYDVEGSGLMREKWRVFGMCGICYCSATLPINGLIGPEICRMTKTYQFFDVNEYVLSKNENNIMATVSKLQDAKYVDCDGKTSLVDLSNRGHT